jgi:hypothetical protein
VPKRKSADSEIEAEIARVKQLGDAPGLKTALADKRPRVLIAAARTIADREITECGRAVVEAFQRLVGASDGFKADPQCRAKAALLQTVLALEADGERDAYLSGLRYAQREPAFGSDVDTAGEIRGLSVLGMVRARHPDSAVFAAEALADPERAVRIAAAQALGEAAPEAALPLLRYKLEVSDPEPEVTGACYGAYLALSPASGLELARALLARNGEAEQEALLLALGESRLPGAFPVLRQYSGRASAVACVAMALLRLEPATDHLLWRIASGGAREAGQALKALAHFRHDEALCERVRAAAASRKDAAFSAEVERAIAAR